MSVEIQVESTDRTENVEYDSVMLNRALTSQVDTFRFDVVRTDMSGDWKPAVLDEVLIKEGSTVIFGGQIVDISEELESGSIERVSVSCKDYSYLLDREMVADTYTNKTIDFIINDIITNYTTGFTGTAVDAPIPIGYIAFNYEYPSKCLQQLAELAGYDWYVDESKDVHFFAKDTTASPFNLTDDGGLYYLDTLRVRTDVKNLRNSIMVRGGTFEGTTVTEEQEADGEQFTFQWAYKYSNVVVEVDTVNQTVGVDFIDDPASFDCLYNFQEKTIKFPIASKPTAGQVVSLAGNPHIPVIVKVKDPASVTQHGEFQYKIVDKSINSKDGARDRAKAELQGWREQILEASFDTKEAGLAVGQQINVQSTLRGIDQNYIINRISTTMTSGKEFIHQVGLVTTQSYGMMEFLQKLLIAKDKEIEINPDETIHLVETFYEDITITESVIASTVHENFPETMTMSEVFTAQALDYAVEFVVGEQAPSGVKRQFILDGSPLH